MKMSVIMQSYLHDYPGSRSNPELKFIRSVNSFLSQTYENKELIIVSDGCEITKSLYDSYYKNNKEIRFVYLDKKLDDVSNTQEIKDNNKKFTFRGIPRGIGCYLATGDIISYLDSDDIILPYRLLTIAKIWENVSSDVKWINLPIRYVHPKVLSWPEDLQEKKLKMEEKIKNDEIVDLKPYAIKEPFLKEEFLKNNYRMSSSSIVHRKNIKSSWKDSELIINDKYERVSGYNEDHAFGNSLIDVDKCDGQIFNFASYVVCHWKHLYDV